LDASVVVVVFFAGFFMFLFLSFVATGRRGLPHPPAAGFFTAPYSGDSCDAPP